MNFAQIAHRFNGPVLEQAGRNQDDWMHPLFGLLVVLVLAGVAVYLIKSVTQNKTAGEAEKRDPIDYAKERFAKGEISKEELAEIKKELK